MKSIFERSPSDPTDYVERYEKYRASLLPVPFQTVTEYLTGLEQLCRLLKPFERSALIYACAAVSDYYIPDDELSEHKIPSGQHELLIRLKPVPKRLGSIKGDFAPDAFVVSFKLETDASILEEKCRQSADKYKQDMIIGNILQTRANQVHIFERTSQQWTTINRSDLPKEIEFGLVNFVCAQHRIYRNKSE